MLFMLPCLLAGATSDGLRKPEPGVAENAEAPPILCSWNITLQDPLKHEPPQDGPTPKSRSRMRDRAEKHICTYRAAQNGRDGSRMNELIVGKAHPERRELAPK